MRPTFGREYVENAFQLLADELIAPSEYEAYEQF